MKQKTKQLIMTLALLLTVATGAWAESKPIGLNVEYAVGDEITSTTDVYVWWGYYVSGGDPQDFVIKITSSISPTISELDVSYGLIMLNKECHVYDMSGNYQLDGYSIQYQGEVTGTLEKVHVASGSGTLADPYVFAPGSAPASASATPVPLTWDAATPNTATLTNGMPAGNVTVSVEYFPQATMSEGAVTAAEGVKATTEDALVTIDETKITGVAKLMYYVSTDAEATAPDYNAEGWTDQVPTAANYTQAGKVNVWYYAVGADNEDPTKTYSDGDICAAPLTVSLGDAPLWNAEFDLSNAPEEDKTGKWSTDITGEGVIKGTEVKVTYSGTKKVLGVKAEKKAAAPAVVALNITSPSVGQVIGSDGKNYAYASLPSGVTAVAKICYVSGDHGLALALTDEGRMNFGTAQTTCAAHTPAFTSGTWKLASKDEWDLMTDAAFGDFSSVGGNNLVQSSSDFYWSSSDVGGGAMWAIGMFMGEKEWMADGMDQGDVLVRACFAF